MGPDGSPMNLYEITLTARDYTRECAGCGKAEEELGEGRKLSICTGCRRARYCRWAGIRAGAGQPP